MRKIPEYLDPPSLALSTPCPRFGMALPRDHDRFLLANLSYASSGK